MLRSWVGWSGYHRHMVSVGQATFDIQQEWFEGMANLRQGDVLDFCYLICLSCGYVSE